MKVPFCSVLAAVFLAACGEAPTPSVVAAPAPPPVSVAAPEEKPASTLEKYSTRALDLIKDSRDLAGRYTDDAKKALEKIDLAPLKEKGASLLAALDRGDFITAEEAANDVDANLESDVVSRSVSFLKIEARDGAAAAAKAVDDYLKSPDLSAAQREYFLRFKEGLNDSRTKKGVELACHALILGCNIKYGHEGSAMAGAVIGILFDEKAGIFKDYGILRGAGEGSSTIPETGSK